MTLQAVDSTWVVPESGWNCSLFIVAISSVEQYYNTVIVIDYQLQIPLHFDSTAKTEPYEYHFNLLTQSL